MARQLAYCNVGARYLDVDPSHPTLRSKSYFKRFQGYLKSFPENYKQGTGLFLWGPYGAGKTSLAVCVMKEALQHGLEPYMVRAGKIPQAIIEKPDIAWLRSTGNVPEDIVLQSCDVLVIDNLNKELSGKWQSMALEDLVRDRYEDRLITVVTSNLPPGELSQVVSEGTVSLLADTTVPLEVSGVKWRRKLE